MKKFLLLIALCGTSGLAFAQDFGKTLITGSINYNSAKNSSYQIAGQEDKTRAFSINPQVGFFVSPTIALGVSATYTRSIYGSAYTTSYPDNLLKIVSYESITNTYSAGPFVRMYKAITPKLAFFGHGMGYYSYGKNKVEHDDDRSTSTPSTSKGGGFSLNPGLVFFPSNTIGIEATLGRVEYDSSKSESEGSTPIKSSGFDANFGLSSVSLGISLYLGRTASE